MKAPRWTRPPVAWERLATRTAENENASHEQQARVDAVRAARFAAYTDARRLGQSHRDAVRASNRTVRKVARALGYAYPRAHELTF